MLTRIWRGWTTPANAEAYERLLRDRIFPSIAERLPQGYRGFAIHRRETPSEVEFLTQMWFDSVDAIRAFVGEDYEAANLPESALPLLKRFDARVAHYEVLVAPPADVCS